MFGESVKRTDFEGFGDVPVDLLKDEEEGMRGRRSLARAKSGVRAGLFGWSVEEVVLEGKPRNCEVRSSYWLRRRWICSCRSLEVLQMIVNRTHLTYLWRQHTMSRSLQAASVVVLSLRCLRGMSRVTSRYAHLENLVRDSAISLAVVREVII